jgi:hypothetical protein
MQTSPILQSKISETKKRLSESVISDSSLSWLSLCALLLIMTYASRAITLGGNFGLITLDSPVVSRPFADKGAHNFEEKAGTSLGASTMVIAVTPGEMIFGDLLAFTVHKSDVRNKFVVPHLEGSPQITGLLKQADEWMLDRKRRLSVRPDGLVLVLPDPAVPVAVISGIVQRLNESRKFSHVILAGGVL